jgi:hypothetical protein
LLENLTILIVYAVIGLTLALWPIVVRLLAVNTPVNSNTVHGNARLARIAPSLGLIAGLALIAVSVLRVFANATSSTLTGYVCVCALIAAFLGHQQGKFILKTAVCVFAALSLTSALAWWKRGSLTWAELFAFTTIVIAVVSVLRNRSASLSKDGFRGIQIQILTFVLVVSVLSFITTLLHDETALVAWHHWGAYIGSSELLLAGARPFLDFPAQYGLGPTLTIAAACGSDCWVGTYYLVGSATFLFCLAVGYLALHITQANDRAGKVPRWLVLVLCLVCCFVWAGYPARVSLPLAMPSAGGIRFFPAVALVLFLISADSRLQHHARAAYWGHFGWCIAALWSPESGFYASCIWWPYYLLLRASRCSGRGEMVVQLIKALATLVVVALALVTLSTLAYWLIYRAVPEASAYFAYALNPPGRHPIDVNGAVWVFVSVVVLASINNWQTYREFGNTARFRCGLLLLLLLYSTFSYFLGRSHDNNVLNLAPFILLVLLQVYATSTLHSLTSTARALLGALLGWTCTFGWSGWQDPAGGMRRIEFNATWVETVLPNVNKSASDAVAVNVSAFPADAARALAEIQRDSREPVTVISSWNGLAATNPDAVWSAFHGPANIVLFSSQTRRTFLARTAKTLKRSGWLIVARSSLHAPLIADFDSVYRRTDERAFGTFHAIRYAPRQ